MIHWFGTYLSNLKFCDWNVGFAYILAFSQTRQSHRKSTSTGVAKQCSARTWEQWQKFAKKCFPSSFTSNPCWASVLKLVKRNKNSIRSQKWTLEPPDYGYKLWESVFYDKLNKLYKMKKNKIQRQKDTHAAIDNICEFVYIIFYRGEKKMVIKNI